MQSCTVHRRAQTYQSRKISVRVSVDVSAPSGRLSDEGRAAAACMMMAFDRDPISAQPRPDAPRFRPPSPRTTNLSAARALS